MSDFTRLVDLASARLGGRVIEANDEFFAPKENLLKAAPPVFVEHRYTARGKWMDGWETRRRRTPGHDWCIIRLGLPGILRGVVVDTSYFKGNYPQACSLEACALAGAAPYSRERARLSDPATEWVEALAKSVLEGHTRSEFAIDCPSRFTHLRFNIFPDGGVARLRVHGEAVPDGEQLLNSRGAVDLAAAANGGSIVDSSDQFFSAPLNLLMPGRAARMSDGWETRRRRGPGFDWVIVRLGAPGRIERVELDTKHFKGNYPESCSLDACWATAEALVNTPLVGAEWLELLPRAKLRPDALHRFERELRYAGPATHVRLNIFPDGGVSRLRIYGRPASPAGGTAIGEAREAATGSRSASERSQSERESAEEGVRRLNALPAEEAASALLPCCGSAAWVRRIVAARPFRSAEQLFDSSDRIWASLSREDWLEAFRHHPKIGEKRAAGKQSAQARRWSMKEQSGLRQAAAGTLAALARANREYEARFGYIFIVCASGKSSEEILEILRRRLVNHPETELAIAAEEQRKITRLRLEKLLQS